MAKPPEAVEELVGRFERNAGAYKSPAFNETELRVEFVNPLWTALGWDMENRATPSIGGEGDGPEYTKDAIRRAGRVMASKAIIILANGDGNP